MITKERALEWYDLFLRDMADGEVREALEMGRQLILEKQDECICGACEIHYKDDPV